MNFKIKMFQRSSFENYHVYSISSVRVVVAMETCCKGGLRSCPGLSIYSTQEVPPGCVSLPRGKGCILHNTITSCYHFSSWSQFNINIFHNT